MGVEYIVGKYVIFAVCPPLTLGAKTVYFLLSASLVLFGVFGERGGYKGGEREHSQKLSFLPL